jgi:hypothetical protein
MRECDLYIPVRDYLRDQGWEVHVEVFDADIVGFRAGQILAVELKVRYCEDLYKQLLDRTRWADFVMGATPPSEELRKVKKRGGMQYHGLGFLTVDGSCVREFIKPQRQPWAWHKRHDYRVKKLMGRPPARSFEIGGLPSCPRLKNQRILRSLLNQAGSQIENQGALPAGSGTQR